MSVGHGAMGFLSALRDFPALIDEDGADRRPYVELRPGKEMAAGSWLAVSGSPGLYRQRCHIVLGGELRDVVGVTYASATQIGTTSLTRAESQAECASTAGTFYFSGEDAVILGTPAWDDPSNVWDTVSPWWDLFPPAELYVHLAGDADPNSMTTVALLGFYFSGGGAAPSDAHPTLGPNLLLNGNVESWASSTDANNWTETAPAGSTVAREATIVHGGTFAVALTTDGVATAKFGQAQTLVAGRRYRLSGYYYTPVANTGAFLGRILIGSAGSYVLSNGRDYAAAGTPPTFSPSGGEYRRFLFDFIAPVSSPTVSFEASGGFGTVYLDDLELRRIYRFNPFDARLASDSIPEVMTAIDRLFGNQTVGLASIGLMNGDGGGNAYFESIFGQLLMLRKPFYLSAGGVFRDGTEIYREGWQARFGGIVEDFELEDGRGLLRLTDYKSLLKKVIPAELYSPSSNPNIDTRVGGPRPLAFGSPPLNLAGTPTPDGANYWIRPTRVDFDATSGFGIYEMANPSVAVNGLVTSVPLVYSVPDQSSADRGVTATGAALDSGTDFTYDAATGRISILKDVQMIDAPTARYLDFSRNGVTYVGTVTANAGGFAQLAGTLVELQASMNAAAGVATITVTYDNATHKITIADPTAATLTLLLNSGANRSNGIAQQIGFNTATDRTGALTYTGDVTVFQSADANHFIMVNPRGYKDDASGTYTGSASATIQYPPHIARFIISRLLGVPMASFDASFADTSGASGYPLFLFINQAQDADAILAVIEASAQAAIVMDGAGTFYWVPYSTTTSRRTFYDRDYLSFSCGRATEDVVSAINLSFPYFSQEGRGLEGGVINRNIPGAAMRHGVFDTRPIATYLQHTVAQMANITTIADRYVTLFSASPRHAIFTAKGKLADLKTGDLITLNRSRGLDPVGALVNVKFRIFGLNFNDATGISRCNALEYIPVS